MQSIVHKNRRLSIYIFTRSSLIRLIKNAWDQEMRVYQKWKKGKKSLIEKYHPFNDYKWCCVIGRNVLLSMQNHDGLWTRQTWPSDFNIFSYIFYCNIITIIQAMSAISGRTGAIIANHISPLFWTEVIFQHSARKKLSFYSNFRMNWAHSSQFSLCVKMSDERC